MTHLVLAAAIACTLHVTLPSTYHDAQMGSCAPATSAAAGLTRLSTLRLYGEAQYTYPFRHREPRAVLLAEKDVRGMEGVRLTWVVMLPDSLYVLTTRTTTLWGIEGCDSNPYLFNARRFLAWWSGVPYRMGE